MTDPPGYEAVDRLKDGTSVVVRAIRPDDAAGVLAAFKRLDAQSVCTRFFTYRKGLSATELAQITDVDFDREAALVVTIPEGCEERLIGGGRYVADTSAQSAELAFVTDEKFRGQGIASVVLRHLMDIGRSRGVRRFEADVLAQNQAMLAVFRRCGLPVKEKLDGDVVHVTLPLDVQLPNSFFAQAVIVAKDVAARKRLREKLEKLLANDFPNVVGRIYPLELGPPVGWPIQYRVSGPDIAQVREIAFKLAGIIAANPQTEKVNFDWVEPAREVRILIDQDEARQLGLSSENLASVLNSVISGNAITLVRDDIYLVDVIARATDEQRVSLATLRNIQVPLPNGRTAPLSQFATFDYAQDQPVVWRRDRVPTLTVQTNVTADAMPETVVNALAPAIDALRKDLPKPYAIAVGGTVEESQKSQASVIAVVPVMLLIMLTVLI